MLYPHFIAQKITNFKKCNQTKFIEFVLHLHDASAGGTQAPNAGSKTALPGHVYRSKLRHFSQ
jgi:hypothetical protein